MPQAAPMKGENRAAHTPRPALLSEQRGLKKTISDRLSPSSPVRSGGRPGEEGRGDEGQPAEDARPHTTLSPAARHTAHARAVSSSVGGSVSARVYSSPSRRHL